MLFVLVVRAAARRWIGARLAYMLWALPCLRMVLPPVPEGLFDRLALRGDTGGEFEVRFTGAPGDALWQAGAWQVWQIEAWLLPLWLAAAPLLLGFYATRHFRFCRRLRGIATRLGFRDGVEIIAADVDGPLAFGILRRTIAVPQDFLP